MGHSLPLFLYFVFSIQLTVNKCSKWTSRVRSNRSTFWATTTAPTHGDYIVATSVIFLLLLNRQVYLTLQPMVGTKEIDLKICRFFSTILSTLDVKKKNKKSYFQTARFPDILQYFFVKNFRKNGNYSSSGGGGRFTKPWLLIGMVWGLSSSKRTPTC